MLASSDEKYFILSEVKEIVRYLQQHPSDNTNAIVLRWIEENAELFRKQWPKQDHSIEC